MEVYIQYIFQDLKAVEDAAAFFLSDSQSELGSDELLIHLTLESIYRPRFETSSHRSRGRRRQFWELSACSHS